MYKEGIHLQVYISAAIEYTGFFTFKRVVDMLNRVYLIARITAYLSTLAGIGLLFWGRSIQSALGETLQKASAVMIVIGFSAFLVSYAIYMYSRFIRK